MKYNNEKRITKIVEINSIELQKCKNGQRFKVDVITKHRDGGDPIRPTLRELVEQLVVDVSSLKTDMSSVKTRIDKIENKLNNVIRLNNLKTE
jgi:hypothetical protein